MSKDIPHPPLEHSLLVFKLSSSQKLAVSTRHAIQVKKNPG